MMKKRTEMGGIIEAEEDPTFFQELFPFRRTGRRD